MKSVLFGLGSLFFSLFLSAASLPSQSIALKQDSCTRPVVVIGVSIPGQEKDSRLFNWRIRSEEKAGRFFRKKFTRYFVKVVRYSAKGLQEPGRGDNLAKLSWWIGLVAFASALFPWYTLVLAIPLGITAIILAAKAKRAGSTKRNGKGFGIVAIVGFFIWTLLALLLLSIYLDWVGMLS